MAEGGLEYLFDAWEQQLTLKYSNSHNRIARLGIAGMRRVGFTLIELLVVMAITAILLGLIFGPLYQGFNLTNQARVQVLSQDTARHVIEVLQRDTSNNVFISDNFN